MAWLSGLKIKKNVLLEQQPLVGDDAELAAMRRMIMDDALKRKAMAQRVGILAYIKNRPQIDASVVKNVVSNVSSFNRYRSEKDYEEWVVRERERAARLKASRSDQVSDRAEVHVSDSDGESSHHFRGDQSRDIHAPLDEESTLRSQVKERLRQARADDSLPAPDDSDHYRPLLQHGSGLDSCPSDADFVADSASKKGSDSKLRKRHSSSRRRDGEHERLHERSRDRHRSRSRERDRDGDGCRGKDGEDRSRDRERGDHVGRSERQKDNDGTHKHAHRDECDGHADRSKHRDRRNRGENERQRHDHRDAGEEQRHASGRERRSDDRKSGDDRRERSRDGRGNR
jgi:hypothetical protein